MSRADADVVRRAAIVHRARAEDAPEPNIAVALADWMTRHVEQFGDDVDANVVAIGTAILAETCARPLPASAVGSVCGRLNGHDGGCGAPVAPMPGFPIRTGRA